MRGSLIRFRWFNGAHPHGDPHVNEFRVENPPLIHVFSIKFAPKECSKDGNGRLIPRHGLRIGVPYQALGHHESIYYNNPAMLEHILAGVQYALGDLEADDSPSR